MQLGFQVGPPPCCEIIPPPVGLCGSRGANLHCPPCVMSVSEARGKRPLDVDVVKPSGEHGVGSHTGFKAAGEAKESACAVSFLSLSRPLTTMINFPQEQKGHPRLAAVDAGRGDEIGVGPQPIQQAGVRFRHLKSSALRQRSVLFRRFQTTPPRCNVHSMSWDPAPAHQVPPHPSSQRGLSEAFLGQVAHDLRQRANPVADGHPGGVGEELSCDTLKYLQ